MDIYKHLKKELGNKVRKNEVLANHTTFKIGGPAQYFYVAEKVDDLVKSLALAKKLGVDYYLLGGGSNLLVSDQGFAGLVIHSKCADYKIEDNVVVAEAGVWLNTLILETLKQGYAGLEFMSGIPGTVGGAVCGNAGAWGQDIGEVVEKAEVLNMKDKKIAVKVLNNQELKFAYRDSLLKNKDYILLRAYIKVKKDGSPELLKKFSDIIRQRNTKHPLQYPNAGSIFKNIEYNDKYKSLAEFVTHGKVSMGKLIEGLGFKGKKVGGAQISEQHANFIVNVNQAKAADVLELMEMVEKAVREKYGVELEREVRLLGF